MLRSCCSCTNLFEMCCLDQIQNKHVFIKITEGDEVKSLICCLCAVCNWVHERIIANYFVLSMLASLLAPILQTLSAHFVLWVWEQILKHDPGSFCAGRVQRGQSTGEITLRSIYLRSRNSDLGVTSNSTLSAFQLQGAIVSFCCC